MADLGFGDFINALVGGGQLAAGISQLIGGNPTKTTKNIPSKQSPLEQQLLNTTGLGQQIGLWATGYGRQPTQEEAMRQQFSQQLTNAISGRVGGWGNLNMGGQQQQQQGGGLSDRAGLLSLIQQRMGGSAGGGAQQTAQQAPLGTPGNAQGQSQQFQQILQKLGLNIAS